METTKKDTNAGYKLMEVRKDLARELVEEKKRQRRSQREVTAEVIEKGLKTNN